MKIKTGDDLDKRDLINEIYQIIQERHQITGNQYIVDKEVRKVITRFTAHSKNKCKKCGKPNWELLAKFNGMEVDDTFVNGKCGYCSKEQPKQKYLCSWVDSTWKKL